MFKELGKSFLIYGVASGIGKFVGLFLVPIYSRIFNPEEYGIIDLITTMVTLISIFSMLQLESAISRFYFEVKENAKRNLYISTAFWSIIFLSLIWLLIAIIFSEKLSIILFNDLKYRIIISIASLQVPLASIFSLFTVLMRFLKKPVQYTVFISIQLFLTISFSILFVVYMRIGIIGVFYGQLIGFIGIVILMLFYLRTMIRFAWNRKVLKKLFQYSLPLVPVTTGNWINLYANRFVMLGYLSLNEIGLYTVALKIASVFWIIESAFRMAWQPFFWEIYENQNHKKIFREMSKYVSVLVFFLIAIFSFFSKEVLLLLTPETYVGAAPLIGFLAFSIGLTIVNQTIVVGPGIIKKTIYSTGIYFFSVGVNIISLFIMVPKIGLIGVPLSLFFSYCSMLIIGWYISERLYYIGFYRIPFSLSFIITFLSVGIASFIDISLLLKILFSFLILVMFLLLFRKDLKQVEIFMVNFKQIPK